jgi:menaquinone-dependent protoporphyrinogen oxidase
MMNSVLVAYGTKTGSTAEVAEALAETLRKQGLEVEVRPASSVRDLAGYDAVVLGGALYMSRWHRDARRFLSRHKAALRQRPIAVFALGPIEDTEEQWQGTREQLDKALARWQWLKPVAVEVFGGRYDMSKLGFPFKMLPAHQAVPVTDLRDWEAIRAWTVALASEFLT